MNQELKDKIKDQAKHEDSDGYFGFLTGAEWMYAELEPELTRLKEKLEIAEKALDKYGSHIGTCSWGENRCFCGYEEAIEEIGKVE